MLNKEKTQSSLITCLSSQSSPGTWKTKTNNQCELKFSLIYIKNSRLAKAVYQDPVKAARRKGRDQRCPGAEQSEYRGWEGRIINVGMDPSWRTVVCLKRRGQWKANQKGNEHLNGQRWRPGSRQVPRGDLDPLRNSPLIPATTFSSWQADSPRAHNWIAAVILTRTACAPKGR